MNLIRLLHAKNENFFVSRMHYFFKVSAIFFLKIDLFFRTSKKLIYFPNIVLNQKKIFIFAHYSKSRKMDAFDSDLLLEMKKLGYYIVLVSNSLIESRSHVDLLIHKPRLGRDGIVLRDFARSLSGHSSINRQILFMNNSMIWLPESIEKFIKNIERIEKNVIVFPTESFSPVYHVQPYVFYINLSEDYLEQFAKSFDWVKNIYWKKSAVEFYEMKIFKNLVNSNWDIKILTSTESLYNTYLKRSYYSEGFEGVPSIQIVNPCQHLWFLLPNAGIPGVKRSLITSNIYGIQNVPFDFFSAVNRLKTLLDK